MLEKLLLDMTFAVGSSVTDDATAYYMVKKIGIEAEANRDAREGYEREGKKYFLKSTFKTALVMAKWGSILYVCDFLLDIHNDAFNSHHVYLYGYGSLKYLAALSNVLGAEGLDKAAFVTTIPIRVFLKIMKPINESAKKYDD